MTQVQQFYAGENIFITGGTGFLGKALIEKLLRSCPDIGTIYLLVRPKKGKSTRERVDTLLADSVLDVLRSNYPDFSQKIVAVAGDIKDEGLGLCAADYARIVNEVSIIFHLAATVRFDEKLATAVAINVNGTKYMVDIAKACKNLKVGIYVSTAYSNSVQTTIKEELYPPPLTYEGVNKLLKDTGKNEWSEDELQNFTQTVLGEWPNTYSFTKSIAEGVIAEFAKEIPFAVFRPSIVFTAYREPSPGWVAGSIGLPGMICAAGLGILRTAILEEDITFDIVPVDCVCNALISCAWETGTTKQRNPEEISVYNYVSGNENPVKFKQLIKRIDIFGRMYPMNSALYYPYLIPTRKKWLFAVLEFFLHLIPALMVDTVAKLLGKQPGLYKVAGKIGDAWRALEYFTTQQWNFDNERTQNLWKRMGPTDRIIFPFDMRSVDWDEHGMKMIRGLRKYLVGEPDDNMDQARRRHVYLYIVYVLVNLLSGLLILWVTWKLFCGRGFTISAEALAA